MGRKSRKKRERRAQQRERLESLAVVERSNADTLKAEELEDELRQMAGGNCEFWNAPDLEAETRESHLEDVRAFEAVGSGPSLFEGLEKRGIDLPHPDELNEKQSADKVVEILRALSKIHVFITGFEHMRPREAYSTFWFQTLWEACFVKKKTPGAMTIMDASHSMSPGQMKKWISDLERSLTTVH